MQQVQLLLAYVIGASCMEHVFLSRSTSQTSGQVNRKHCRAMSLQDTDVATE